MRKPKGYVIYEGASQINGESIIAVVTLSSRNEKTGNMASMWILPKDVAPNLASKEGKDESVCGQCPHRHFLGGACYVTLFQAPLQVFKAYHRGNYPKIKDMDVFEGLSVRFGAYGDVSALPMDILVRLKSAVKNNTSYTHQWKNNLNNEVLKSTSMASVDNIKEAKLAIKNSWRTFRVTNNIETLLPNEIICPNTTKGTQCINCGLCKGTSSKGKNIVIEVHGAKKKKFK